MQLDPVREWIEWSRHLVERGVREADEHQLARELAAGFAIDDIDRGHARNPVLAHHVEWQ
ncbi:MAG: hypothetical protein WKG01_39655 [Kofleriaceae bacterium]